MISPRTRRASLGALLIATLGACDILPSAPPKFEETYVVEAASLHLSAADLAPGSVTLNADSTAFLFVSDSTLVLRSLGQMCSACAAANGTTVAKPAFTTTFSTTIPATPNLVAASIAGGIIELGFANGLNFDPIRPSATARGSAVLTVRRGAQTIATLTVDGTTTPFPPGSVVGAAVPVAPFNFDQALVVDVTVTSPAGDPIAIDTSRFLVLGAGPVRAAITQITVSVASRSFSNSVPLDLTKTELNLDQKLQGGAFRFNFTNPFAVGGSFSLTVRDLVTGAVLLDKGISLAQTATSANRIGLTASEISGLLGKLVLVEISGSFDAPTGQLVLTPKQVATFTTLLEIVVYPLGK